MDQRPSKGKEDLMKDNLRKDALKDFATTPSTNLHKEPSRPSYV
jgi:hypothetical protein